MEFSLQNRAFWLNLMFLTQIYLHMLYKEKMTLFTSYAQKNKSYAQLWITLHLFTYIDIFSVYILFSLLWIKIGIKSYSQLFTLHNFLCTIHTSWNLCKTKKRPLYQYNLMCITMWISCAQFFSTSFYSLFPL